MINVSWYDALAYCRWLSIKLQLSIRLPTEWEWQWAAAGDTQQDYPWQGEWNGQRANSSKAGIGRTVAAGLYPLARSPFGVDDMAGNVSEWCLNLYSQRQPGDISLNTNDVRVLHGGSWYYSPRRVRVSVRYYYQPDGRGDSTGFRVLCSPPSNSGSPVL
ncbi:MAG: SUMF1/EgtB/PvdO family nonheme iron enzyme [Polaromonas sp.]|uniref:formylglycine-generating enzyme family protein n=1 Tax=Nitrosomonas sp. TaxID=42353 RepID=UPI0027308E70|nr:SUMF1/EgtB/PvdO family nonheme iron enzyme [Nitrosomonas sp.]MDP1548565.1 SUMF1/EgtB/PvdO family nonheme iron enzyme [Nitrosomonas sp.]MDP3172288.1 SUMF1/EgtB/PvdO family nonheme iron enzyme [Polaromonas sp.]